MSKALVILSGGQDSTICLYWAKLTFRDVSAVSFNYGQKHSIELESAKQIAGMANVPLEIIDMPDILKSRSPLVNENEELETYSNYEEMDQIIGERVELTFVPMRNALFLTIAANRVLEKEGEHLITGVCEQDNANYPDCREGFILSQQETINEAIGKMGGLNIQIHTPLMYLSKAESIDLAKTLDGCMEALAFSHTCYSGVYPPCGDCHSCVLRAEGFKQAGIADPLIERSVGEKQYA